MGQSLPSGTVTLVFTDIEGSTRLLLELGQERYRQALATHRSALREAFARFQGYEVDYEGDSFFYAFASAAEAISAVGEAMKSLAGGRVRIRVGVHTGEPGLDPPKYVGLDVHRAARIMAAAHGGQVLVSQTTRDLLRSGEGLRDLGEHRLKDLSAPVRLYQFGEGEFPPPRTLYRTNLPVPVTAFLGREREVADTLALLQREQVRLVTLTGPGGTGKTRLALQAAAEVSEDYPDGIWWVPLGSLRDPQLVVQSAAHALGADDLTSHIADKTMLILFDNFEHVAAAGADVSGLLAACPNLRVLVTSREPLHVSGEQEYPVPPLAHAEAVTFFVARARAVRPDFAPDPAVSEICHRLDELPLALELAATRVKALSTEQILQRLERRLPLLTGGARDAPERQRTLSATIAWSYELLSHDEQRMFARLAVFRGGCTLEAAEDVSDADVDTLHSLVDKSLTRYTEERYSMLETIRECAEGHLASSDEADEIRRRHAEYFLTLAEEAEPHLRDEWVRGGGEALDRLQREHDNLRAALDWLDVSGETQWALRLAAALSDFWLAENHLAEGGRRLERALEADEQPTVARARALNGVSLVASFTGDQPTVRLRAEEALALYRELGNQKGVADSLFLLGHAAIEERDWTRAEELLDESIALYSDLGEEDHVLWVTRALAQAYVESGDPVRAQGLYESGLHRAQSLGNPLVEAALLESLASLAVTQGRAVDALPLLAKGLTMTRDLGDPAVIAGHICYVAQALAALERPHEAAQLLACFEALREEIGGAEAAVARLGDETLATIRSQIGAADLREAWEQGRALAIDQAVALAHEELERDA